LAHITAVILAGGLGTRLHDVVADRPKAMAEINERPFLYYLLDQLSEADIERVVICTGYMAEMIEEFVGFSYKGLEIKYSREQKLLGTGGALKSAGKIIHTEHSIVLNGDSYIVFDFPAFMTFHSKKNANITILANTVENVSRFGVMQMREQNEIAKFVEKGEIRGRGLINAGVYLIKSSLIKKIPKKIPYSLERELFPSMVGNGLFGFETKGEFIDIGTPESYAEAGIFFDQLRSPFLI